MQGMAQEDSEEDQEELEAEDQEAMDLVDSEALAHIPVDTEDKAMDQEE